MEQVIPMKPLIKKETHYNLVLMRDDTNPRTLRVSDKTLRAGIASMICLFLFCFAGIAGGIYYWQKYRGLQEKHGVLEKETAEMRLQLERLVALETLITASNGTLPHAPIKHEEVGVPTPAAPATLEDLESDKPINGKDSPKADAVLEAEGTKAPAPDEAKADASAAGTAAPDASSGAVAGATPGASREEVSLTPPATLAGGSEVQGIVRTGPVSIAPEEGLALLVAEESPLRINDFTARYSGPQSLRVQYDLVSSTPGAKTFSGSVSYFVTFNDGIRLALPMQDGMVKRFSISRRKRILAPTRIPAPYNTNDVKEVDVIIELADGLRYHQIFAVK
ncbi:hypothetical protein LJC46_07620 [Desulfovibrio sp. OttesenSCG-928-G15]|nr:hypothetical protein [Desulfovibrio sp. OttesenSCG-928-G15]